MSNEIKVLKMKVLFCLVVGCCFACAVGFGLCFSHLRYIVRKMQEYEKIKSEEERK